MKPIAIALIFLCALHLDPLEVSFNLPVHPVVDAQSGYLLGSSKNGKWLSDKQTAALLKGDESYKVYGLSTRLGMTGGSKPRTKEAPCEETHWVTLQKNHNGVVALAANWNGLPRKARVQNPNQKFYRREVARILQSHGLKKPVVKISQLWRIDLDGDGVEEVLLSATRYANPRGEKPQPHHISPNAIAGDYSLVLLRKVVNGKVQTITLAREIYSQNKEFSAPSVHRVTGVLDANGDGKMEIVLNSRYYEGDATALLEVQGSAVKEVLASGCGA